MSLLLHVYLLKCALNCYLACRKRVKCQGTGKKHQIGRWKSKSIPIGHVCHWRHPWECLNTQRYGTSFSTNKYKNLVFLIIHVHCIFVQVVHSTAFFFLFIGQNTPKAELCESRQTVFRIEINSFSFLNLLDLKELNWYLQ